MQKRSPNSKGHVMMVALVILVMQGPPRRSEGRKLFFTPLSLWPCFKIRTTTLSCFGND